MHSLPGQPCNAREKGAVPRMRLRGFGNVRGICNIRSRHFGTRMQLDFIGFLASSTRCVQRVNDLLHFLTGIGSESACWRRSCYISTRCASSPATSQAGRGGILQLVWQLERWRSPGKRSAPFLRSFQCDLPPGQFSDQFEFILKPVSKGAPAPCAEGEFCRRDSLRCRARPREGSEEGFARRPSYFAKKRTARRGSA